MSAIDAVKEFYSNRDRTPVWAIGSDGDYTINESLYVLVFIDEHPEISLYREIFTIFDNPVDDIKIVALIYNDISYYIRNDTYAVAERIKDALKCEIFLNKYYDEYLGE